MGLIAIIIYRLIAGLLGIRGYGKSPSQVSLALVAASLGKYWAGAIAFILVGRFGVMLGKTKKLIPAGIMMLAGLITLSMILLPV